MARLNKILTVAALVLISGTALAEPPAESNNQPALRGPAVRDGGVPGMKRHFGEGGDMKERMGGRIPPQAFVRALEAVRGENVDANVRLTPEQDEKIRAIMDNFRDSMQKFHEEHKAEFRALRPKHGEGPRGEGPRGEGPRGEGPRGEATADGAPKRDGARRQLFEELMAQAPKPEDAQAAVFTVLTDAQKLLVQARLEEIKNDMAERRLEGPAREFAKRQIERGGKGGPRGGPQGKGSLEGRQFNPDNLPPKLKEKFDSMTPEERAEAIKQFRERMAERRGPDGPGRDGRGGPGMEKLLEKLTPEQKAELESMTPQERRDLFRKLRENAIEKGEIPPGPPEGRRGHRPPPPPRDGEKAPPPPKGE
jgi:DNA-binding MarR family transcriptional regulator